MDFIDGFVAAVPVANRQAYLQHAEISAKVFREYGALSVTESWAADVPDGETTSFPLAVKCRDDENVVFSFVRWPSREVRDAGMAKLMDDPRMQAETNPMPFDGKRLIYGGFDVLMDR